MAFYYPPTGFLFQVSFDDSLYKTYEGKEDAGFQEVTGLTTEIGMEEYREGGENRFAHRLPNPVTYSNIVLKRGLLQGSAMFAWYKKSVESFEFTTYDLNIILLNENREPLQAWNVVSAYPVKWEVSGLNAMDAQVVVDAVELRFQYFRQINFENE
ncbi:MAG: phage tail protein [Cyclobacteriaceae bacterium]